MLHAMSQLPHDRGSNEMNGMHELRKAIELRFSGSAYQNDLLRITFFSFMLVHSVFSLTFLYRVNLAHYASHSAFEFMPTGLLKFEPLLTLARNPTVVGLLQMLFSAGCLLTVLGFKLETIQPVTVVLGFFYFGVLNSYLRETNTEYMACLALVAFLLPSEYSTMSLDALRSKRKVDIATDVRFSPQFFFCLLMTALLYLNSATSHIFFFRSWLLSGEPLKNMLLFKLNNDLNNFPYAPPGMSRLVEWLPATVFHVGAVSSILFELTFGACLIWPRLRIYYLAGGTLFHVGILLFMNILFGPTFAVYLGWFFWECNSGYPDNRKVLRLFVDGQCPLCRRTAALLERLDVYSRLRFVDVHSPDFNTYPRMISSDCLRDIHAMDETGNVYVGYWSYQMALTLLPATRIIGFFMKFRLISIPGTHIYHVVARRRRIDCSDGVCNTN